ncbi:MAG: anthranilate phosphoribosyltransferase [Bacteroidota bacterium]
MKEILNHLFEYKTLSKAQAKEVLMNIGQYNSAQIASFLTIYMMRSITVEELEGFRDALLELCLSIDLSAYDPMDVCGTGGDGKDTFNISTLASFVVAGAGQRVAKHGNYGVSSLCGSSTVMEYLGYHFTNDKDFLTKKIEEANICFLHAPLFHPVMKYVGPIRKELGVKTFFNMLGPMVNPAFPKKQLVGVFNLELARLYAYLYQQSDKQFAILHALDGYDEISLTGSFKMISKRQDQVLTPQDLGMDKCLPEQLYGGTTVKESADIFLGVLKGEGTHTQNQAVIANAGMALYCANEQLSMADALATARESLVSGKAMTCFQKLISDN